MGTSQMIRWKLFRLTISDKTQTVLQDEVFVFYVFNFEIGFFFFFLNNNNNNNNNNLRSCRKSLVRKYFTKMEFKKC